ncbi:MAG: hypothetical protein A3F42_06375 [Gammaproteobacteria bacterium RIFCSPHIGHO2_12_FULL_37_34]|nr:MAG: hypothetical protein A3F42_06375 [Gammaproteobacteria bacterium RIFCSPHIGHO2_12_FULL_37_34]
MFNHFFNNKIAGKSFITYAISDTQGLEFVLIEKPMINGQYQQEENPLNCWSPQESAKLAAKKVGPHVYTLNLENEIVNFLILGCQGSGNDAQKNVAELLHHITVQTTPAFVLMLGDHLYDYGAKSPGDPGFNERFHHIYHPAMRAIMILGNHDANYHSKRVLDVTYANRRIIVYPSGEEAEMNEVAHTYLFHKSQDIETAINIFQQENITLNDLSQWNMPYFFYSLIIGNTQIFCLDSNTYAKDFLYFKAKKNMEGKINQAEWIQHEYHQARLSGKKIIFAQHHPLYTCGKRFFKSDSKHYLYQEEINELNNILRSKTESYNMLLTLIFKDQEMVPDLILAAHDHFTSYYNNNDDAYTSYKIRQGTFGGGGGKLQSRESFAEHPYVGCHFENYGFGMLTCSTKHSEPFTLDFFTLKNDYPQTKNYFHLKFNDQNHLPLRIPSTDTSLEIFRQETLPICNRFFEFLQKEELQRINQVKPQGWYAFFSNIVTNVVNYSLWTNDEAETIKCVQEIINYFNQFQLSDKETVKNDLFARLTDTWPKNGAFSQYIDLCQHLLGGEIINNLMMANNEMLDKDKTFSFA